MDRVEKATNGAIAVLVILTILCFIFPDYAKWMILGWIATSIVLLILLLRK